MNCLADRKNLNLYLLTAQSIKIPHIFTASVGRKSDILDAKCWRKA